MTSTVLGLLASVMAAAFMWGMYKSRWAHLLSPLAFAAQVSLCEDWSGLGWLFSVVVVLAAWMAVFEIFVWWFSREERLWKEAKANWHRSKGVKND